MKKTSIGMALLLALAVSAPAQAYEAGCTQPLPECTKTRVAQLKSQSRAFTAAARQKPSQTLTSEERALVDRYDNWLKAQSRKALDLAERGSVATTQPIQQSFNEQYLELQRQIQSEHRSYNNVSSIMKTKHDTVKNSLSNVR